MGKKRKWKNEEVKGKAEKREISRGKEKMRRSKREERTDEMVQGKGKDEKVVRNKTEGHEE
jgi:hypothetical protein